MNEVERLPEYTKFRDALERLRHTDGGTTYWMARDIQGVLGYGRWENFEPLIHRAIATCESANVTPDDQFHRTTKMIEAGKGASRGVDDWYLSRYACYLIAMSGESSKKEIAYAKTYFAIQTARQETKDQDGADERRLFLRNRVKEANKSLASAAKRAGVQRYQVFQDAGYRGLYGGLGQADVKAIKGIAEKDGLLDCIGRAELAANEFRITQTEQKLIRESVRGEELATQTHHDVGAEVRSTIRKIGGTMPEQLPAEAPIKKLVAAKKKAFKAAQRGPK